MRGLETARVSVTYFLPACLKSMNTVCGHPKMVNREPSLASVLSAIRCFLTDHSGVVASYIDLYHRTESTALFTPNATPIMEVTALIFTLRGTVLIAHPAF
jgi:hypothetical protein